MGFLDLTSDAIGDLSGPKVQRRAEQQAASPHRARQLVHNTEYGDGEHGGTGARPATVETGDASPAEATDSV